MESQYLCVIDVVTSAWRWTRTIGPEVVAPSVPRALAPGCPLLSSYLRTDVRTEKSSARPLLLFLSLHFKVLFEFVFFFLSKLVDSIQKAAYNVFPKRALVIMHVVLALFLAWFLRLPIVLCFNNKYLDYFLLF